jgi:hypothetical protein
VTPVEVINWGQVFNEYGLPISMLILFLTLILRGWLVPGPTHEDVKKQRDRALDQVYMLAEIKAEQGEQGEQGERGKKGSRGARGLG